jgi:DNA-binding NarL/FixJ family response regulator
MKILLLDDHWLFLEGIKTLFEKIPEVEKVFITDEPKTALNWMEVMTFGLIVTDLSMPAMRGEDFISKVKKQNSEQKIIALSSNTGAHLSEQLKKLGACGIMSKTSSFESIQQVVRDVMRGGHEFIDQNKAAHGNISDSNIKRHLLTPKENVVLDQLLTNKTNIELAEENNISIETIKSHRKNIYRKLGVNNILDLYKLLQ